MLVEQDKYFISGPFKFLMAGNEEKRELQRKFLINKTFLVFNGCNLLNV